MPDAFFKVSTSVQKKTVAVIQADVGWVASESFQIIVLRVEGGMTVLFQMLGAQIQLLGGLKFLRRKQRICRIRHRLKFHGYCFVGYKREHAAVIYGRGYAA